MARLTVARISQLIRKPNSELVKRLTGGLCIPNWTSKRGGGLRTGNLAQAAEDARINLLTRVPKTDPLFQSGEAERLKDDVDERRDAHSQRGTGACTSTPTQGVVVTDYALHLEP